MRPVDIHSSFKEYDSINEIPGEDQMLMKEARNSMTMAYAPYSHFQVGAAVLLENGVVVKGNNQENASYPLGLCAERVAVFSAGANYPGIKIKALAITAHSDTFEINKPVTPCGACRQAIAEYEYRYKHPIRMIMTGVSGKVLVADSVSHFLPYMFTADDLKLK